MLMTKRSVPILARNCGTTAKQLRGWIADGHLTPLGERFPGKGVPVRLPPQSEFAAEAGCVVLRLGASPNVAAAVVHFLDRADLAEAFQTGCSFLAVVGGAVELVDRQTLSTRERSGCLVLDLHGRWERFQATNPDAAPRPLTEVAV
jgi:hypothetical protein